MLGVGVRCIGGRAVALRLGGCDRHGVDVGNGGARCVEVVLAVVVVVAQIAAPCGACRGDFLVFLAGVSGMGDLDIAIGTV